MMKAVVMAGGEGTRLRPLTCDLPKPMARLCGKPVLYYILELLKKHGFTHAAVTLRYLPEKVTDAFPEGKYEGMTLEFPVEEIPLGTAGSVRRATMEETQTVLVISGDALCDFDLTAALRFHRDKNAGITILSKRVTDPRQYGMIEAGLDGRITGFIEKPSFSEAITDLANTGIYLIEPEYLEQVTPGKAWDFAKDLFPLLLSQNAPLYTYEAEGYWCDIGGLGTYLSCQRDMLEGRVDCQIPGIRDAQGNYTPTGRLPAGVQIEAPIFLGENVRLGKGCRITAGSVLDHNVSVGDRSRIKGGILLPGSSVGRDCTVNHAILGTAATLRSGGELLEGSVCGTGSTVGENACILPRVRVWPEKEVARGVTLRQDLKEGSSARELFGEEGQISCRSNSIDPVFLAALGAAAGTFSAGEPVAVGWDGSSCSETAAALLSGGVRAAGSPAWELGACIPPQFRYGVRFSRPRMGMFVQCTGQGAEILLTDETGLPFSERDERRLEDAFSARQYAVCPPATLPERMDLSGLCRLYKRDLYRHCTENLSLLRAEVRSSDPASGMLLGETLADLGCGRGGQYLLLLSGRGSSLSLFSSKTGFVPWQKVLCLCCKMDFEQGKSVVLPEDAPLALDEMARSFGCEVLRFGPASGDDSIRQAAALQGFVYDGLAAAVKLMGYLAKSERTLAEHLAELPPFGIAHRIFETGESPVPVFAQLSRKYQCTPGEKNGLRIPAEEGTITLRPLRNGRGFRLIAEAVSVEAARELCDHLDWKDTDAPPVK